MKRMFLCLLCFFCLCGCQSYRETNRLTIVSAGALDTLPDGTALTCETVLLSPESKSPNAALMHAEGKDVPSAFSAANLKLGTDLYWSHAQVLAVDELLCRNGIGDCLDFFSRSPELRMNCRILAVRGAKASETLKKNDLSGDVPGYDLGQLAAEGAKAGMLPDVPLYRLLEDYLSVGVEPILPAISISKDGQCIPVGAAIFRGDRFAGWLSPGQTQVLSILRDGVDNSILILSNGDVLNLTHASGDIKVRDENSKPHFLITLQADARLESGGSGNAKKLEALAQDQLFSETQALLMSLQQNLDSDALGLGREIFRQKPELWRKIGSQWEEEFEKAKVTIHCQVNLTESGLTKMEGGSVHG